ncbi:caveolae-associated protein 2-like [Rhinatrema bivittatum]|uniref:caveolae-associated protein 2-like n=1 Tax=Rhinatrema bivittatum TaxID=194408 RepID=UPI00112A275A|nr:caveolae-associated protein 2-like [Rhinatrema bivittatum]
MGEEGLQASGAEGRQVPGANPAPGEARAAEPGGPVNALTVLALLEKLEEMLGRVQETQVRMEGRQRSLGNSVRRVQGEVAKLGRSQNSTSNAVSKLLQGSRQVSAALRDANLRVERRREGVARLERIHNEILRKNQFNVLLYQEEIEVPEGMFPQALGPTAAASEGLEDHGADGETFHTIRLSSDEEELGDTGAKAEKVPGPKKAGSLKKAFTFKNIEKMMAKMGAKMVPPEKREKIKKSLSPRRPKTEEAPKAQSEKEGQEGEEQGAKEHEAKEGDDHEVKTGEDHEAKMREDHEAKIGEGHETKMREDHEAKMREDHEAKMREDHEAKMRAYHEAKMREDHEAKMREDHEAKMREDHEAKMREDHEAKMREDHEAKMRAYHEAKMREDHEAKMREDHEANKREAADTYRWTSATVSGNISPGMPYDISEMVEEEAGARGSEGWWMVDKDEESETRVTWDPNEDRYDQHRTRTSSYPPAE